MDFTVSKCNSSSSNGQLIQEGIPGRTVHEGLPSPQLHKVSLPSNAIIKLPPPPPSWSTMSKPSLTGSHSSSMSSKYPAIADPLQSSSIVFTNKPVVIFQEDMSLLSRVLGHREHNTPNSFTSNAAMIMQQHSTSGYSLGPGMSVMGGDGPQQYSMTAYNALDRQLRPALPYLPNYSHCSLPEVSEIQEENTKQISDAEDTTREHFIETQSNEYKESCISSVPNSPPLLPSTSTKSLSPERVNFHSNEEVASIPSKRTFDFPLLKSESAYFCQDQEKEVLHQDSDSELEMSESHQEDFQLQEKQCDSVAQSLGQLEGTMNQQDVLQPASHYGPLGETELHEPLEQQKLPEPLEQPQVCIYLDEQKLPGPLEEPEFLNPLEQPQLEEPDLPESLSQQKVSEPVEQSQPTRPQDQQAVPSQLEAPGRVECPADDTDLKEITHLQQQKLEISKQECQLELPELPRQLDVSVSPPIAPTGQMGDDSGSNARLQGNEKQEETSTTETVASLENVSTLSPDSVEEPPLKRQRLSDDPALESSDSSTYPLTETEPCISMNSKEIVTEWSTNLREHTQHCEDSYVMTQTAILEYPHEPVDTADDGTATVGQTLPTESAREHALVPNVVRCRNSSDSDNDRGNPGPGRLPIPNRGSVEGHTVLVDVAQVPHLQQEEQNDAIPIDIKVPPLKSSPRNTVVVPTPFQERLRTSMYSNTGDQQIVPEDISTMDHQESFTEDQLYSDTQVTKRKPDLSQVVTTLDEDETMDGPSMLVAALEKNSTNSTTIDIQSCGGGGDRCDHVVVPPSSFGQKANWPCGSSWQSGRGSGLQTQNSEMTTASRLNLTKPYLRLGLSRRQRCKPLHSRK